MATTLNDALNLSLHERIIWAEALWESIHNSHEIKNEFELSDEQKKYLDQVAIEFDKNPKLGKPMADVFKHIRSLKK